MNKSITKTLLNKERKQKYYFKCENGGEIKSDNEEEILSQWFDNHFNVNMGKENIKKVQKLLTFKEIYEEYFEVWLEFHFLTRNYFLYK